MTELIHKELTESVIGAFFEVYNEKKFGFVESVYANSLQIELRERGHIVQREVPYPTYYKTHLVGEFRADIVVDGLLIVELKSTLELHPSAKRQLFNYLAASRLPVGLLFHFGPEPKFYRQVFTDPRTAKRSSEVDPHDLPDQRDPQ